MDWTALETALREGCAALGLAPDAERDRVLIEYLRLLTRWNRTYNLTAVRDPAAMVPRHLLDSLTLLPHLPPPGSRIGDLGTGAGLPGLPLAVAAPDRRFVLIDSAGKKVRFLRQVVAQLALDNVTVIAGRAEALPPDPPYDAVLARAVATVPELLALGGHLCRPGGRLLFMKGVYPAEELTGWPSGFELVSVVPLTVPGESGERHLVIAARPADPDSTEAVPPPPSGSDRDEA